MHEFEFIELLKPLAISKNSLSLSDDIAILGNTQNKITDNHNFLNPSIGFSTDTICEHIHFLENTPPNKLAEKLLRVNISDLTAKGIVAKYYSLNLSLPHSKISKEWFLKFIIGLKKIQIEFNISLLGGDTTSSCNDFILSATIFGETNKKYIARNSAKEGDIIFITGFLGDSFLGLDALKNQRFTSGQRKKYFIKKYETPLPRVEIIKLLLKTASSSIDISDGLIQDLNHILKASSVGANLNADFFPFSKEASTIIKKHPSLPSKLISHGDDYEILFTASKKYLDYILHFSKQLNYPITKIGTIEKGSNILLTGKNKKIYEKKLSGFKHFSA